MILEIIIGLLAMTGNQSCAGIDNTQNKAVWASPRLGIIVSGYREAEHNGRATLLYNKPVPQKTDTLVALIRAEDGLQEGEPGPKIRIHCEN